MGKKKNSPFCQTFPEFFCTGKKSQMRRRPLLSVSPLSVDFLLGKRGKGVCCAGYPVTSRCFPHYFFREKRHFYRLLNYLLLLLTTKMPFAAEHHSPQNSAANSTLKKRRKQQQQQLRNRHRHTFFCFPAIKTSFLPRYIFLHWTTAQVTLPVGSAPRRRLSLSPKRAFFLLLFPVRGSFPPFLSWRFLDERRTQKRRRSFT